MRQKGNANRSGVAAIWALAGIPAFVTLLCFAVEIGNIWLARSQLENALESAALSAALEWGRSGAGATTAARNRGVALFKANQIQGVTTFPFTDNLNPSNVNENASPTGNLVFGRVTTEATDTNPFAFDPNTDAGCGGGSVVVTVFSNASLQNTTSWTISYPPATPLSGLAITEIVIDLQTGTDPNALFDFSTDTPDKGVAIGVPLTDYSFDPTSDDSSTLTITFINGTFNEGDSIQFGARVKNVSTGTGINDGDGIGQINASVTATFSNASTGTGTFIDTKFRSPANNDDESIANIAGGGSQYPAVKAQATITVDSICGTIFGTSFGPWTFTSNAYARYDCVTGIAQLVQAN